MTDREARAAAEVAQLQAEMDALDRRQVLTLVVTLASVMMLVTFVMIRVQR